MTKDCKYLKKAEMKNSDLWQRFLQVYKQHHVTMNWLQGHAGHALNERCDTLASNAALQGPWQVDKPYVASCE